MNLENNRVKAWEYPVGLRRYCIRCRISKSGRFSYPARPDFAAGYEAGLMQLFQAQ